MLQDFAAITSKSACHKQERLSQARVVVTRKSGCHKKERLSKARAVVTSHTHYSLVHRPSHFQLLIVCRNWIKGGPHSIEHKVICNSIYTTALILLTVKSGFINAGTDLAVSEVRTELQPEQDPGQNGIESRVGSWPTWNDGPPHMTATTPLCVHASQLPHDWTLCAARN